MEPLQFAPHHTCSEVSSLGGAGVAELGPYAESGGWLDNVTSEGQALWQVAHVCS